jgi:hypothetical protein
MGAHINKDGRFQSDRYPSTPADKVPLSVNDKTAQDLLWQYAERRRKVDAEFSADLESRLETVGFAPPALRIDEELAALRKLVLEITEHYDPMFGTINTYHLDDREWMKKAAEVLGEDAVFPWKRADREADRKSSQR